MNKVRLTILGSATSQGVPVIGCDCPACRSSDPRDNRLRNSGMFSKSGQHVVVDTGPDFRAQMLRARISELAGVLYSHEHNDHVAGLDDLRPFCFRQRMDIPLYALPRVAADLRQRYAYAFSGKPYPGVPTLALHEIEAIAEFKLGGMQFQTIPVAHGKLPILGYRCEDIAYLTDVKTLSQIALKRLQNLRVLVLTCLQFKEHHSHLNYEEAIALSQLIGAKRTIFTHLSHRIGTHAELQAKLPAGIEVGYDGMVL